MIIVSQNAIKYGVGLPVGTVLRVNLAWHKDLANLPAMLMSRRDYKIFLDVPIGRRKPPSYHHEINDVVQLVVKHNNIEYVAISNIENENQVIHYQALFKETKLVPKIESYIGLRNIKDIILALHYKDKVIMLDHQDLYADLLRMGVEEDYLGLVDALSVECKNVRVRLLKTVGVVFSNGEDEA